VVCNYILGYGFLAYENRFVVVGALSKNTGGAKCSTETNGQVLPNLRSTVCVVVGQA
jgi:hypothetical protein